MDGCCCADGGGPRPHGGLGVAAAGLWGLRVVRRAGLCGVSSDHPGDGAPVYLAAQAPLTAETGHRLSLADLPTLPLPPPGFGRDRPASRSLPGLQTSPSAPQGLADVDGWRQWRNWTALSVVSKWSRLCPGRDETLAFFRTTPNHPLDPPKRSVGMLIWDRNADPPHDRQRNHDIHATFFPSYPPDAKRAVPGCKRSATCAVQEAAHPSVRPNLTRMTKKQFFLFLHKFWRQWTHIPFLIAKSSAITSADLD